MGSPDISGELPCPDYLPLYLADRISEIYGIILINNEKTIFFRVSAVSESHHTERSRYHPPLFRVIFLGSATSDFHSFFVVTIMFCDFAAIIMFI